MQEGFSCSRSSSSWRLHEFCLGNGGNRSRRAWWAADEKIWNTFPLQWFISLWSISQVEVFFLFFQGGWKICEKFAVRRICIRSFSGDGCCMWMCALNLVELDAWPDFQEKLVCEGLIDRLGKGNICLPVILHYIYLFMNSLFHSMNSSNLRRSY